MRASASSQLMCSLFMRGHLTGLPSSYRVCSPIGFSRSHRCTSAAAADEIFEVEENRPMRVSWYRPWSGKVDQRAQLASGVRRVQMIPVDARLA
jgi:hypothetical protein